MKYKNVALLVGGMGAERKVSLVTGQAFAKALDQLNIKYTLLDAAEDLPARLEELRPDVALLALHGKFGEDGTVQGLLEYLKIPYSTSGVLASSLCMDKYFSKQIYIQNGIPTPDFEMFNLKKVDAKTANTKLSFPVVVKPSREGSSVGVSICKNLDEFRKGLEFAGTYDYEVLVEDFIDGSELTVPILNGRVLTPIEIVPKTAFYDFERKYTAGATDYFLPARVPESVVEACKMWTQKAWEACRVRVYARMDFRVDKSNRVYLIEVNTQPGCTPTSLFPKSAAHEGIPFENIIAELIESATLDYAGVR